MRHARSTATPRGLDRGGGWRAAASRGMKVVSLPQPGGCACGAVRYRLAGMPLLAFVCHCHHRQSRSGREVEHGYGAGCRTMVFAQALIAPAFINLRPGALGDAGWVAPIVQTFVESAIPWAVIPGVRVESWEGFDYAALGREWAATAPRFV